MKRAAIHACKAAIQKVFRAAHVASFDTVPRLTMPTLTRKYLSESQLAAELETSAPRIARARQDGRIKPDATAARGRERLYDHARLAELREALTTK